MTRRLRLLRTVFAATALIATSAAAQDAGFLGYKIFHDPFPYYVDGRGGETTEGLSLNAVRTAANGAFAAWQGSTCSYVSFTYAGESNSGGNPQDDISVTATWITSAEDALYATALGGGEALAAAIPLTYAGATLRCDIYLNGVDYDWTVSGTGGRVDLQSALTREVGHCLGLSDGFFSDSVMFVGFDVNMVRRSLSARDDAQICAIYPQNGYGSSCTFDGGRGSCNQPGRSLKCIRAPLADGGTTTPFCSEGCEFGSSGGTCEAPHACRSSALFSPSFNGACMPNNNDVTQVGAPCTAGTVAKCGPQPKSECLVQASLPSGSPLWKDGYCTQDCTVGQANSCPSGSSCVNLEGESKCLQGCRAGSGDCRSGYSCVALPGYPTGVCVSSCGADEDCPNGAGGLNYCRSCDGLCFEKDVPGGNIGDPCQDDSSCGPAQFCHRYNYGEVGVCTQFCNTACTACPNGSICAQTPSGQEICLRSCQEGSCHPSLQCGLEDGQRGCKPQCTSDVDCPDPWRCGSNGQCYDPGAAADAGGSCVICFEGEGGSGAPNPRVDAGTGGGGTGNGCGCGAAGDAGMLWGAAVFALTAVGRRRRWRLR